MNDMPTNQSDASGDDDIVERAAAAVVAERPPDSLGNDVLRNASAWAVPVTTSRSKALLGYSAVAALVFVATSVGSYFVWGRDPATPPTVDPTAGRVPIGPSNSAAFAPDADTFYTSPSFQPARAMAGVYRPNFRSVVAGDAPVMVATGQRDPLQLGAHAPYRLGGHTLHIWDWSKSSLSRVEKDTRLWAHELFALSPDGRHLVWPKGKVIHLATGEESKIDLGGEYYKSPRVRIRRIKALQFTPRGDQLAVLLNDINTKPSTHPLRPREITNTNVMQLVSFPGGELNCTIPSGRLVMAFTSDSARVVVAEPAEELKQTLVEYDGRTGELRRRLEPRLKGFAYAIESSPDDQYLAVFDGSAGLMIWNWSSGELLHAIDDVRHASYTTVMSFSPDSKLIALASVQWVEIVDVRSGELVAKRKEINGGRIRWSADGKTLTVISRHSYYEGGPEGLYNTVPAVHVWDWKNNKLLESMDSPSPKTPRKP